MDSDAIFSALSDPNRRAIMALIGEKEEMAVGEIVERFDTIGRTGISSHLRVLRLSGLVTERREGNFRYYSIATQSADTVVAFLSTVYKDSLSGLSVSVDTSSTEFAADERTA